MGYSRPSSSEGKLIETIETLFDKLEKEGAYEIVAIKKEMSTVRQQFEELELTINTQDKDVHRQNIKDATQLISDLRGLIKTVQALSPSAKDKKNFEQLAEHNEEYRTDMDYHDRPQSSYTRHRKS